jgi:urea transport system ATP-binding protein
LATELLTLQGVNHHYGESHTLWDVDLTVLEGSRTCLMGRNGVGKTTLLRCIMGLEPLSGGSIYMRDQRLDRRGAEARAGAGIAYVPQGREIFPRLTVEENLRTGLGVARSGGRIPDLVFDLFPVLAEMLSRRGGDLSGGQQQQLAIGRALVLNPDLLILDEPTEGIQPNIVREIGDIIVRLNDTLGLTVLLVEQKLPFARRVADGFAMLEKGRKVAEGTIAELNEDVVHRHLSV